MSTRAGEQFKGQPFAQVVREPTGGTPSHYGLLEQYQCINVLTDLTDTLAVLSTGTTVATQRGIRFDLFGPHIDC
jgi:hypothetical protein